MVVAAAASRYLQHRDGSCARGSRWLALAGCRCLVAVQAARQMASEARDGGANTRWVGVPAGNYEAMVTFVRQVLGFASISRSPPRVEIATSEGDELQIMAPGDPYYDFFTRNATGPVPLFEVDDVHSARQELGHAVIAVIGATGRDSRWEWIHFRAPDGNLYELANRRPDTAEPAQASISTRDRPDSLPRSL